MKKLWLTGAALTVLVAGPAMAADMRVKAPVYRAPPPPVYSWTGCYIGANVGGAWARQDVDTAGPANVITNQAPAFVTLKGSSAIGGVHAGCNVQLAPMWVAGIEGDWSAAKLDDTASFPNLFLNGTPVPGGGNIALSHSTKWLASVRGRLGVAVVPNVLVYVTGGGAWNRTDYAGFDNFLPCPINCVSSTFSSTKGGWVVGGGAEWAPWNNNWLVRLEYLYYRFQGVSSIAFFPPPFAGVLAANFNWHDLSIGEIRVGLSYKFGGPVYAAY